MAECYLLRGAAGYCKAAVLIHRDSVTYRLIHLPACLHTSIGRPAAFADHLLIGDGARSVEAAHYRDVGLHAFAQESALLNAEVSGGIMAHQLCHLRQSEPSFISHIQHHSQGELHRRHARGGLEGSALLLGQEVGGMVGAKALEIIKQLNLNNSKKNAYFADQIRFLEKLIINNNFNKK